MDGRDNKLEKPESQKTTTRPVFLESEGRALISIAREAISSYVNSGKVSVMDGMLADHRFQQKMGCFVTLKKDDAEKSLRGCIGFPEPIFPLSKALQDAAVAAATEDPRFSPLKKGELESLLVEVSLLTNPMQIVVSDPREFPRKIEVGKDGLIMRWTFGSGLLLPQVASEYNWDAEEFLCNLSMKAGAPPDQWLVPGTLVYKFRAEVFEEISPKGAVVLS
jgi:uncharacterized protein